MRPPAWQAGLASSRWPIVRWRAPGLARRPWAYAAAHDCHPRRRCPHDDGGTGDRTPRPRSDKQPSSQSEVTLLKVPHPERLGGASHPSSDDLPRPQGPWRPVNRALSRLSLVARRDEPVRRRPPAERRYGGPSCGLATRGRHWTAGLTCSMDARPSGPPPVLRRTLPSEAIRHNAPWTARSAPAS